MNQLAPEVQAEIDRITLHERQVHDAIFNNINLHEENLAQLYSVLCKTKDNWSLLYVVKNVVMATKNCPVELNTAQDYDATLTVADFRCLHQDYATGLCMTPEMAERLSNFHLNEIYWHQKAAYMYKTLCFQLNTFGIIQREPFEEMQRHFAGTVNIVSLEMFDRNYLVFPNFFKGYGYCTLVINPLGAIKTLEEDPKNKEECIMVHIGCRLKMQAYVDRVSKGITDLMKIAMRLEGKDKGYEELKLNRIKELVRPMPTVHHRDRPYQLLHLVQKLLAEEPSHFDRVLHGIKNNFQLNEEINETRKTMLENVRMHIFRQNDNASRHLLQQTEGIMEFCRQEREKQKKEQHARRLAANKAIVAKLNAGEPVAKRFKPTK